MINCRWKLVVYPAGARGDFVCGWAGLLPNVINNFWGINPVTGVSHGNFETKLLDYGSTLDAVLKKQNMILNADSQLFYVGPCHGYALDLKLLQEPIDSGALQLYVIDISTADLSTILWEYIVKTYLSQRNTVYFQDTHQVWLIDSKLDIPQDQITNKHRIEAVIQKAHTLPVPQVKEFLDNANTKKLDYTKLFTSGGSHYLCDQFELTASPICHSYWDHVLQFVTSPDTIDVWGHTWRKKDFF